jgi:hypothetical protein
MYNMADVLRDRKCLPFPSTWVFGGSVLLMGVWWFRVTHLFFMFSVLCVYSFVCLRPVSYVQN